MEILSSDGQRVYDKVKETHSNPPHTQLSLADPGVQTHRIPILSHKQQQVLPLKSFISHDTPEIEKWQSARDIFMQYDISRPSGWLSETDDLSLSGDGNASPRSFYRYCHICSTPTWAPTHCSSCGHRFCEKCMFEPSIDTQANANLSYHSNITTAGDESQYASAFRSIVGSIPSSRKRAQTPHPAPHGPNHCRMSTQHQPSQHYEEHNWQKTDDKFGEETTSSEVSGSTMRSLSHRNRGQSEGNLTRLITKTPLFNDKKVNEQGVRHGVSANRVECDDSICRATHTGHYPFRHAASCSRHGSEQNKQEFEHGFTSNVPARTEVADNPDSDSTYYLSDGQVLHRPRSSDFLDKSEISEHVSSGVDHRAYNVLDDQRRRRIKSCIESQHEASHHFPISHHRDRVRSQKIHKGKGSWHRSPEVQKSQAISERSLRGAPISVSKRRELFESIQGHTDIALAKNKMKHDHNRNTMRKASSRQGRNRRESSSDLGGPSQSFIET
ncbi:hypothetical protein GGS21DRAFT_205403 [Xylaria nigripes]|nr:hypothetical protein GGS21DRAFT_205403 [Xylaria nigripes]